jgi:prepilin-type N-terminal cleavage/methylation domain-containing protein
MAIITRKTGFSLIELAISIAVIGVIISIILSAKSLMDSSKLKNIMADFVYYQTAFNNFNTTYKAYPGDMANATDYWTTTCATVISCNGDGSGTIDYVYGSTNSSELERAWKHLELAKLIRNGFSVTTQNRAGLELEVSAPKSVFKQTGYSLIGGTNIGGVTGSFITSLFPTNINVIYMGAISVGITQPLDAGALTADNAYYLDSKFDDGKMNSGNATGNNTGKIRTIAGYNSTSNNCIDASGYYNVSENSVQSCVVGFQLHE